MIETTNLIVGRVYADIDNKNLINTTLLMYIGSTKDARHFIPVGGCDSYEYCAQNGIVSFGKPYGDSQWYVPTKQMLKDTFIKKR